MTNTIKNISLTALITLLALTVNAAPAIRTVTGEIKSGTAESCLNVIKGKSEKCYVFTLDVAVTKKIFSACKDGDTCAITGSFDDDKEHLLEVKKVERVKP